MPITQTAPDFRENAEIIFEQLGGKGRLCAMIGAKNFAFSDKDRYASFRFAAQNSKRLNFCKISLCNDLYTVEFGRVWGSSYTEVETFKEIYADSLISLFQRTTGLAIHL